MLITIRLRRVIFITVVLSSLQICRAFALSHISSTELIQNAKEYDGKIVLYKGEVIGEVMKRGDFAWVNLHDGEAAIGVWLPYSLTQDIGYAASYKSRGDIFEVTGTFNRACLEHSGDLDIHAKAFKKLESGRSVPESIDLDKKRNALILLGVLLLVWILKILLRR